MFTLKGIRKAMRDVFPRKTFAARRNPLELVKGNSPVKVNPVVTFDARAEMAALDVAVREKLIDFLDALEGYADADYDGNDDERERFINAAVALGFPEWEYLDEEYIDAFAAAAEYHGMHHSDWDTMDTYKAIHNLCYMFEEFCRDNYNNFTFICGIYDDAELSDTVYEKLCEEIPHCFEWLLEHLDMEAVTRKVRNDGEGKFTSRGYFQYGNLEIYGC